MKDKYDMTGHFRDLPRGESPKKPGLTQGAQKRVDGLKKIKEQVVTWTRTLYGSDSSAAAEQFQYQQTWFRKSMSWCQSNGFKKTASAISDFLKYLDKDELDESLQPELAHVIVSINADIQAANKIFGTKATKRNPLLDLRSSDALAKDIPNAAKYKAALDTVKPYVSEFSKIFSKINRMEPNTPKSIAAAEVVIPRVKKFLQILISLQRTFKFLKGIDTSGMQEFIDTKNSRKFVIWPNSVYKRLLEHSKAHYGRL